MLKYFIAFFLAFIIAGAKGQEYTSNEVAQYIESYKKDRRGPFHRIKWFCADGTIREPKDPCLDSLGGGIQHASYKESVIDLRKKNQLYFGEILAAIEDSTKFLDASNNFERIKQYQLGKYLASVDNGWVLREGQFYRGAIQSEDEQEWGRNFFLWLLQDKAFIDNNFYLLRQILKDIPHNGDTNLAQQMRSQSKILSEDDPKFMDIRIKIHGQPEYSDIKLVRQFIENNGAKWDASKKKEYDELVVTMTEFYRPLDFQSAAGALKGLQADVDATKIIIDFLNSNKEVVDSQYLIEQLANVLYAIRLDITEYRRATDRLELMDLSNKLETTLLQKISEWNHNSLVSTLDKISTLSCLAMGTGIIEPWEYNEVEQELNYDIQGDISIGSLNKILSTSRGIVEWSSSMTKAHYQDVVDKYALFEPLSPGFIDDRVRSSVALPLGEAVSQLGSFISRVSNISNNVLDIKDPSQFRGLNPGYAFGELIVVDGNPDYIEVESDKIYIFEKPPHDLKPVAGIMTVSEGNLVSHVQLLARNLGIPNAALSKNNLLELKKYAGKKVFYAVSPAGVILLKLEEDMLPKERALFVKTDKEREVIEVPISQINLSQKSVVDMRDIDAKSSGILCGPKAANLAELKKMFPDKVVEGLIIPFGIFRDHMDQEMPNTGGSYWNYLEATFSEAEQMKENGSSQDKIQTYQLRSLKRLQEAILKITLRPELIEDIEDQFKKVFNGRIGTLPVFLRSDTNMEDLKEFTGAGLNLTLFNILSREDILEGIKKVWASPYSERSFKWRQSYLSNPENVFPSILIIPSVDVDYSGVMITKGINVGTDEDVTIAFSRGAGGAVDGQSAETRLISAGSQLLLSPARQADYIRLPKNGGTKRYNARFSSAIINEKNIADIRDLTVAIRNSMGSEIPYDVEFGFENNKLWLFQIRPFVENKMAKTSEYLASLSPKVNIDSRVSLNSKIEW